MEIALALLIVVGATAAVLIHFLQDVVIFSALVLAAANKSLQGDAPQAARV
jgi:hypothetical protein